MARAEGSPRGITGPFGAAALFIAAFALAGCQLVTGGTAGAPDGAPVARGDGARLVERDLEAPEVFQVEEPGLWDGRPSLGGIWVAHPAVADPERVIIRNVETGASVTGALFRRERDQPGPRFQISSEAANALGILAGRPTPVRVTAVRLQQVEIAPPAAATEEEAAEPGTAPVAAPVTATEPEAPRGWRTLFQRPRRAPAAETAPAAEEAAETTAPAAASAPEAPRGLRGLFQRRRPAPADEAVALPEAEPAVEAEPEVEPASRAAVPGGATLR